MALGVQTATTGFLFELMRSRGERRRKPRFETLVPASQERRQGTTAEAA
jgi:hypothetical protein